MKNKIFDRYLYKGMDEFQLIENLDSLQAKSQKDGVIYTPKSIVEAIVELSAPLPNMNVVEPSCGHGVFLIALLNYMNKNYKLKNEELLNWFLEKVSAFDINESTIKEAREILSLYFQKKFNIFIKPQQFVNIIQKDGLVGNEKYDIALGNPPYIRTKNIEKRYLNKLRQNFKSCEKGNIDIYYAFLEKYSTNASISCFIVPNGFLTNSSGKFLRDKIKSKTSHLIDFKEKLMFNDARVYTCIIKTCKNKNNDEIYYKNNLNQNFEEKKSNEIFKEINKITNLSILSELATLRDKLYTVKNIDGKMYGEYNGKLYEIERNITRPFFKITKYNKDDPKTHKYIIFPYGEDKKIIKEDELRNKYPKTYQYLLDIKPELLKRDKGKTHKYEAWYAYGRKQGLHKINDFKFVAIPRILGDNIRPYILNINKKMGDYLLFTSGFVIVLNNENKNTCDIIMSDVFYDYVKNNARPLPGKNNLYYSLNINLIKLFIANNKIQKK